MSAETQLLVLQVFFLLGIGLLSFYVGVGLVWIYQIITKQRNKAAKADQ